jgi:hypothetical protein
MVYFRSQEAYVLGYIPLFWRVIRLAGTQLKNNSDPQIDIDNSNNLSL